MPRQDPDLTENDGVAGRLTQRLVDRKLEELRRGTRDPKRASDG